jgi:hypothetical protein
MSNTKPASIWITQFLLIVWIALPGIAILVSVLFDLIAALRGFTSLRWMGEFIRFLVGSTLVLAVGLLAWALQRRRRYSRAAAGLALLLMYLNLHYGFVPDFLLPQHSVSTSVQVDTENDQQSDPIWSIVITFHLAVALLLYRLWFGKRVRLFFAGEDRRIGETE